MWRFVVTTAVFLLLLPFLWVRAARPAQKSTTETLYNGVTYDRKVWEDPSVIIHIVTIDLTTPGIRFQVTPPNGDGIFATSTTASFLQAHDLQIGINGSFYQNTVDQNSTMPLGLVIANGKTAVNGRSGWPTLCISSNNSATIQPHETCPSGTQQAIAGNVRLVQNGEAVDPRSARFPGRSNAFQAQPRTAVALDEQGETMWLVVVDGRQPNYSAGMTLANLAQFLVNLGAHEALNLDGGGSSTLVTESWIGTRTLNSPIHNGIPTWQRAIPTHLGVYANP